MRTSESFNIAMERAPAWSNLPDKSLASVIQGARDISPVTGLTHNFYRYPARFSPNFVRAVIKAFTRPGDWIVDPFSGGGTTLVEAMALGRHAIGVDISALATFICEAKTQILIDEELRSLRRWLARTEETINIHTASYRSETHAELGYFKNLSGREYWRLRKAIEQLLASVTRLRSPRSQMMARCIVLRTAQWALDSRKSLPAVPEFRRALAEYGDEMLSATAGLKSAVLANTVKVPRIISLNRSAAGLENEQIFKKISPPRLVLTSPPYPGIHVLYHRWQVDGRKEAPAPFWIADQLDGAGLSHYTLGDRKNPGLKTYFDNLKLAYTSIANLCDESSSVIQMVAFSNVDWQLPQYLEVMAECGLTEVQPWDKFDSAITDQGRLWRNVPNRRWHARQRQHAPGAREVVLVHRKTGKRN